VHDRNVVDGTSGSFGKKIQGSNPHFGAFDNQPQWAAKNVAYLETLSPFHSAYREEKENIPHTRNNWLCCDFKERRIVSTHYTIRTNENSPGGSHLRSWLVETLADRESWRQTARKENTEQLNGPWFTGTFAVAGGEECRFIRLVNIGRNHRGSDSHIISAWEIFGSLIE
jgi:hypothetical protein